MSQLEEMLRTARVAKEDLIEAAADSALAAIKGAGAMSLMPAPHLPTTGLLLLVHPEVYDRIIEKQAAALTALSRRQTMRSDLIERALRAIAEGYAVSVRDDRYIVVENPDFQQDNGSDPNLVIDVSALRQPTAGVKVKALEWVRHPTAEAWRSDTMLGTYQVWMGSRSPAWQFDGLLGERINEIAENEEAAKTAAQAHYERRVLSALSHPPAQAGAVPVDLLVAEVPDEDDIEEAISGSIDLDWTPRVAAREVMRLLAKGVNRTGGEGEHLERCCPNDPNNDPKNENIDASTFNLVLSALTDLERYLRDTPHHNSTQAAAARYAIRKAGG